MKDVKIKLKISDLIDIIHFTIIEKNGQNDIILSELSTIDNKIKLNELKNYDIDENLLLKYGYENKKYNY